MLSGCCAKTQSFEFGCVDKCVPQFVDKVKIVKQEVPQDLLRCREFPIEPVTAEKQSEVAAYTVELWLTADECKRNLTSIEKLVDSNRSK